MVTGRGPLHAAVPVREAVRLHDAVPLQARERIQEFEITIGGIAAALLIVLLAYVIARLTDRTLKTVADRMAADRFRITRLIPIVKVAVYAVAGYLVVESTVDPTARQMLAFAGFFGAALGFGFKELVTDMLGGLAVLFERPYRIGDKISVGDTYGEVVDIGLRSTQVETLNDDLITIPNHVFFKKSIVNANAGHAEMLVTVDFYVNLESDPSTATRIVEEALTTSQYVYVTDEYPIAVRIEDGPYYFTITGKAYINDLRNETAFRTDVTERVLAAFRDHGIEPPQMPPRSSSSDEAVAFDYH